LGANLQGNTLFVFYADGRRCALPVSAIAEVMRPLRPDAVPGAPDYVKGAAMIRGVPTPVIDLGTLLSGRSLEQPGRMIAMKVNDVRRAALLADGVLGLCNGAELLPGSAPLLENCASEVIAQLGKLDGALLTVLRAGRIVPDDLWLRMEQR
jgi:purine-binding chemotaxis protein CheW